jgi:hypothetical protein
MKADAIFTVKFVVTEDYVATIYADPVHGKYGGISVDRNPRFHSGC